MGLLNIIRRMHLREQLSIREISRRTGLSRNTIAKYLSANAIEPKFATPACPERGARFSAKQVLLSINTVFDETATNGSLSFSGCRHARQQKVSYSPILGQISG